MSLYYNIIINIKKEFEKMIKKSKKFLALGLSLATLVPSVGNFSAFAAGGEEEVCKQVSQENPDEKDQEKPTAEKKQKRPTDESSRFLSLRKQNTPEENQLKFMLAALTGVLLRNVEKKTISLKEFCNDIVASDNLTYEFLHGELNQNNFDELIHSLNSYKCKLSEKDALLLLGSSKMFNSLQKNQENRLTCLEQLLNAIGVPYEKINSILEESTEIAQ